MEELKIILIIAGGTFAIGAILFFIGKFLLRNSIKNENNRKISKQDILTLSLVVPVLLVLFWLIENGNKWAAITFAAIMISAKVYAHYIINNKSNENN